MQQQKQRNCDRFRDYDESVTAFFKWCRAERGEPCEGCTFQNSFSCMGEWLMSRPDETSEHPQMSLGI